MIHITDLRIRILLFSSVAYKMPTNKMLFLFLIFLLNTYWRVHLHQFYKYKVKKTSQKKIVEITFFLTFFACWWKGSGFYACNCLLTVFLQQNSTTIKLFRRSFSSQNRFSLPVVTLEANDGVLTLLKYGVLPPYPALCCRVCPHDVLCLLTIRPGRGTRNFVYQP